jgi:hypothetical protein
VLGLQTLLREGLSQHRAAAVQLNGMDQGGANREAFEVTIESAREQQSCFER